MLSESDTKGLEDAVTAPELMLPNGENVVPLLALTVPPKMVGVTESEEEKDSRWEEVGPWVAEATEDTVVSNETAGVPVPPTPPRDAELAGDPDGDPTTEGD